MRILYVEDNATNVILVQRVANMGKHEVINYDDGQEALDRFEQDKPGLILLDVQLRGSLTGLDVAHILRTRNCNLPIIAVTAYAMKGDRQRCLDAGCDDYLPKPISVAELVTVFKRYGDAVASGKPIHSTYKLVPLTTTATPDVVQPIVISPSLLVATPVEAKPAVADTSSTDAPIAAPQPIQEKSTVVTPVPVGDAVANIPSPLSSEPTILVTVTEPPTAAPPADALVHRATAPMNAEP